MSTLVAERWFLYTVFAFISGVGVYFSLTFEPDFALCATLCLVGLGCACAACRGYGFPWGLVIGALFMGIVWAKAQATWDPPRVMPEMSIPFHGTLEGEIEAIPAWNARGAEFYVRVFSLSSLDPTLWPSRVRLWARPDVVPKWGVEPGDRVRFRVRLLSLKTPSTPGGYDPGRQAWFSKIGAQGRVLGQWETVSKDQTGRYWLATFLFHIRRALNQAISEDLPGVFSGMTQALITGERGEITEEANEDLRISGLYHILSISGLHMTLVGGGVFFILRAFFALFELLALGFAIKKWAGGGAILAGFSYLLLSGGDEATWRAFLMMSAFFVASMLNRTALSFYTLAWAALLITLLFPHTVLNPGFQMSFLAVLALIAVYEGMYPKGFSGDFSSPQTSLWWRRCVVAPLFGVVLSFAAGGVTTIVSAYHFQMWSPYGAFSNLLATPLVEFWIMPLAFLGALAVPFDLHHWPFTVMEYGQNLLLGLAHMVAQWPGARGILPAFPSWAAWALATGVVIGCFSTGVHRLWGGIPLLIGLLGAFVSPRPDLLINPQGTAVLARGADGLLVPLSITHQTFHIQKWLQRDGDASSPEEALARPGWTCAKAKCTMVSKGHTIVVVLKNKDLLQCPKGDIVLVFGSAPRRCPKGEIVKTQWDLLNSGPLAFFLPEKGKGKRIEMQSVKENQGKRPWEHQAPSFP